MRRGRTAAFALAAAFALVPLAPPSAQDLAERVGQAMALRDGNGGPEAVAAAAAELRAILDVLGPNDPAQALDRAFVLNELGVALRLSGRPEEALALADEAATLAADAGGPPSWQAAFRLNAGLAAFDAGRLGEGERALAEALALSRLTGDAALAARAAAAAAETALALGRAEEALTLIAGAAAVPGSAEDRRLAGLEAEAHLERRDAAAARAAVARMEPDAGTRVLDARALIQQGDFEGARAVLEGVAGTNATNPMVRAARASALYNLAEIEFMQGRFSEAAALNDAAEVAFATAYGPDYHRIGLTRHRRALIEQVVGNWPAAAEAYEAALDQFARSLPVDHSLARATRVERSLLVSAMGDPEAAAADLRAILAAWTPDPGDYNRLIAQTALGLALWEAGADAGALDALEEVRRIRAAASFREADEPRGLLALADIHLRAGRLDLAREAAERAAAIHERAGMTGIDRGGESTRVLAQIAWEEGDEDQALDLARRNSERIGSRLVDLARLPSPTAAFAPRATRAQVAQHLRFLWALSDEGTDPALAREMFLVAQLVHLNETTRATTGFVRRIEAEGGRVGPLLDQRARSAREAEGLSRLLAAEVDRDPATGARLLARVEALRREVAELDASIAEADPDVAELLAPRPEPWDAVAASLGPEEALWLHATFEDASYVFLVEQDRIEVRRTTDGAGDLAERVGRLRASVDLSRWPELPPFAFDEAEALFASLLGPFEDRLPDLHHLVLVPDGAAQELAFAMLARRDEDWPEEFGAGHPQYRFLGLTHALSLMPSPRSFLRLSRDGGTSGDGFMGFGDPVLDGSARGDVRRAIDRGTGLADPTVLSGLFAPLPETAEEIAEIASGFANSTIFLGQEASEATAKAASYDGVRVISFATHAVVSGDFDYLTEPALVLTPPAIASDLDDGLLTTSEIAALDLDADLVLLSGCNTGSTSGRPGAAGLSGLASGFFEAGARTMVVTHWTILSVSSLAMMPPFIEDLTAEGGGSDAPESLRRTMQLTANNPYLPPAFSHPALWAPFAVVGG